MIPVFQVSWLHPRAAAEVCRGRGADPGRGTRRSPSAPESPRGAHSGGGDGPSTAPAPRVPAAGGKWLHWTRVRNPSKAPTRTTHAEDHEVAFNRDARRVLSKRPRDGKRGRSKGFEQLVIRLTSSQVSKLTGATRRGRGPTQNEGDFVSEARQGRGTKYADGGLYVGEFLADKRHGKGRLDDANGAEGDWKADALNGQCTITYTDGGKYSGQCVNGKRSGQGRAENPLIGVTYDGGYLSDQFHGHRRLAQSGYAYAYEGDFSAGLKAGRGKEVFETGSVVISLLRGWPGLALGGQKSSMPQRHRAAGCSLEQQHARERRPATEYDLAAPEVPQFE